MMRLSLAVTLPGKFQFSWQVLMAALAQNEKVLLINEI